MYEQELAFAHQLADRAADIGLGMFLGDGLQVDASPTARSSPRPTRRSRA